MINLGDGYSIKVSKVINILLDTVYSFFMAVGSNLDYNEIYGTVFPIHKQNDQISGMKDLRILHEYIRDDFPHNLIPLYEYILFNTLYFVYESSDDGYVLDNDITELLNSNNFDELNDKEDIRLLKSIHTPYDLIGVIFEDIDFLDVSKYFQIYKRQPEMLSNFLHVDLDYYQELMPDDIKQEYWNIKLALYPHVELIDGNNKNRFKETVTEMIQCFKQYIEHKKVHALLNNQNGRVNEKQVQILFNLFANLFLKDTNILVNAEVDTGRGCIDFYFSIGKEYRSLIELKLDSHQRYEDGINYQLPAYLLVENVDFGIFVLICYSIKEFEGSKKLFQNAQELSQKLNKDLRFVRIDATGTNKSASNIKNESEMKFEN